MSGQAEEGKIRLKSDQLVDYFDIGDQAILKHLKDGGAPIKGETIFALDRANFSWLCEVAPGNAVDISWMKLESL